MSRKGRLRPVRGPWPESVARRGHCQTGPSFLCVRAEIAVRTRRVGMRVLARGVADMGDAELEESLEIAAEHLDASRSSLTGHLPTPCTGVLSGAGARPRLPTIVTRGAALPSCVMVINPAFASCLSAYRLALRLTLKVSMSSLDTGMFCHTDRDPA
jgi:hypothetical protein